MSEPTPEQIEAGLQAWSDIDLWANDEKAVVAIYTAMRALERPSDEAVERIFAEVACETGEIPPMDDKQIAYCVRAVKKARATIAAMPEDRWQPIATAPKDGTPIILAVWGWHPERLNVSDRYVTVGRWLWSPEARLPHEAFPDDGGFLELNNQWGDGWGGDIGDLWWRPLPEPPIEDTP